MQSKTLSTLDPERSRDALQKLREAAEKEADIVAPGVVSSVSSDMDFDVQRKPLASPSGDPNNHYGAAKYQGQNSEHIGNGTGGPR